MGDPNPRASLAGRLTVARDNDAHGVVCDAAGLEPVDLALVDALARAALQARRFGRRLVIRHASPELRELLVFAGLSHVMDCERDAPGAGDAPTLNRAAGAPGARTAGRAGRCRGRR